MRRLALALVVSLLAAQGLRAAAQRPELGPNDPHRLVGVGLGGMPPASNRLSADFFAGDGPGPHPAVILVHGRGFSTAVVCIRNEGYYADFLAPAGYAVFSLDYRLAPEATLEEMVADVQRWVRYVRHSAAEYDIDPNKIALLGASIGGPLSTRAGLALPSHGPKTYYDWDTDSDQVQAVVTLDGIRDIAAMPDPRFAEKTGLLETESKTSASPLSQVREYAPPFLFLHGNRDDAASIQQSTVLLEARSARRGTRRTCLRFRTVLTFPRPWVPCRRRPNGSVS